MHPSFIVRSESEGETKRIALDKSREPLALMYVYA